MAKFVSLITVNYNGQKYLGDFLASTLKINYPRDSYEVIVVDNNSADGSVDFIKRDYPGVRVIESKKNLGFGGGNNLGMRHARGDLFFLVNNDTVLHPDALKNIVATFADWSKKTKVGGVNAKLVLMDAYLPLTIEEAFFSDYSIPAEAWPKNHHPFVLPHEKSNLFIEKVFLPFRHDFNRGMKLRLKIKPFRRNRFRVFLGDALVYRNNLKELGKEVTIKLDLGDSQIRQFKTDLIQNAGNFYFRDGFGRDRGAIIYKHRQYYEPDYGQYNQEEIITGFCGAGVLLNKQALVAVGYFNKDFFMYYEDADLSFRMKERGWRIIYSPKAVVRHIHAGSSQEWSAFFVFHVERGRMLFVAKHWPRAAAIKAWIKYLFKDTIGVPLYYFINEDRGEAIEKFTTRLKVNISLVIPFVRGLFRVERISSRELKTLL